MSAPVVPTVLSIPLHTDARGVFSKPFHAGLWEGAAFALRELYWTRSDKSCVRGLHFQTPPFDLSKLVWVSAGSIVDVIVDVRPSPNFGDVMAVELGATSGRAMWIPPGFAHGFQALEDDTVVNYAVDAPYAPDHDSGILFSSIDFAWPLPIGQVSDRDLQFVHLSDFVSPFEAGQ